MPERPLRVAVLGAGKLGTYHARILAEHPGAELAAVVDIDPGRGRALARELSAPFLTDAADLSPELDAAIVAVPTVQHARVGLPLLERGISCLIEKPLAATVEEADLLIAAAEKGGAQLSVGHVERFQPGLRKVRELGLRPRFIECHRLAPFSFRSTDIGVVHDLMIHDLDLVLDLMGSEVESIDSAGVAILTDHEDVASVRLIFADGGRANVTASRASLKPMRRFRLFASDSYVSLDFQKNYALLVQKGPDWERCREELRSADPAELAQRPGFVEQGMLRIHELELEGAERPLQAEVYAFLEAVRLGRAPEVTGQDGRRALALADRIAAAIRDQSW
jgi:predicted dehydrogenase